jgi:hypothetical protein
MPPCLSGFFVCKLKKISNKPKEAKEGSDLEEGEAAGSDEDVAAAPVEVPEQRKRRQRLGREPGVVEPQVGPRCIPRAAASGRRGKLPSPSPP